MSDDGLVMHCPACGRASLAKRKHSDQGRPPADEKDYRCKRCTHTFDEDEAEWDVPNPGGNGPQFLGDEESRERVLEALSEEVEAL